jgi:hypothetical protein
MTTWTAEDLIACPECLLPAEIIDQFVLTATDGPVPHARTVCVAGHRFMLPTESLPAHGP